VQITNIFDNTKRGLKDFLDFGDFSGTGGRPELILFQSLKLWKSISHENPFEIGNTEKKDEIVPTAFFHIVTSSEIHERFYSV
jgi:hypothetical protein